MDVEFLVDVQKTYIFLECLVISTIPLSPDERKIKKEEVRIETKVSAIEKEKETLRLKQVVIENKADPPKKEEPIETKKEEPPEPPKVKEPEPAKMKEPEPPKVEEPKPPKAKEPEPQIERNSFRFEGGNLMFYE